MPTIRDTKAVITTVSTYAQNNPRAALFKTKLVPFSYDIEKVDRIMVTTNMTTGQITSEYCDIWLNGCCSHITITVDYETMLADWGTI